ncbi:hypothetical protein K7432_005129 [Basidiobolus ranarum]|uniref:Uncharacterized protein n=1 Tax=Basidiobolus ranarum TaxID=34480 RepID=A0ABR2W3K8_9FUNG
MIVSTTCNPNSFQETCALDGACIDRNNTSTDPSLCRDCIRISENQYLPTSFVLSNLRKVGSYLFNNPYSSNTCLYIRDSLDNEAHFWLHDFYFAQDCQLLYRLMCRAPRRSSLSNEPEMIIEKKETIEQKNDQEKRHIYIKVPSIIGFSDILKWLYSRDDEKWLQCIDEENFDIVMQNVAFLRLSHEAYYVLAQFYENL